MTADCLDALGVMHNEVIDCLITDPPYGHADMTRTDHLLSAWLRGDTYAQEPGYMGLEWDIVLDPNYWRACYRVLKPGAFLGVFAGSKNFDLVSVAIRLAGFEKRETISVEGLARWYHGQGMPHGDHLKPAWESILIFRKPGPKTNRLRVGETRIGTARTRTTIKDLTEAHGNQFGKPGAKYPVIGYKLNPPGRYPPNVVFMHHPACSEKECDPACAVRELLEQHRAASEYYPIFRYQAKPGREERGEHPTQKPLALCQWLVRLLASPGSLILDPFTGLGTIPLAARLEGCSFIGIERDPGYAQAARARLTIGDSDDASKTP